MKEVQDFVAKLNEGERSMTEGPYKLPEGWRWVRLGEVCSTVENGFAFRKRGAPSGDLLHLRPYNIAEDGTLDLSQRFYVPSSLRLARHKMLQPGDVLFNNTNSVELVGKTALVRDPLEAAFSNHVTLLRSNTAKAEGAWIALTLQALWRQGFFTNLCNKWIGQAGINTERLKSVAIPLPPLEEQRRIVARIEELLGRVREARRLREEAKQEAERLWQAVLAQTFPRPGSELPEGWRWVQLGNVADVFSGTWGKDPSPQNSGKATLVRVIRVSDIKETLTIDYDNVPWRCVAQKDVKRLALRDGDIVVVKSSGSKAKVISGRAALFRQQPETFLPSNFVFAVRCNTDKVNPGFLWYWLNSDPVKRFVEQMVATFTYPNLKKSDYVKVPIPLPPLEEQKRIVVYLQEVQEKIKALKVAQEQTEEQLKRLEQAILDKAFRGEL